MSLLRRIRNISVPNRGWAVVKLLLAAWIINYILITPSATLAVIDLALLATVGVLSVGGALVSVVGIVVGAGRTDWARKRGTQFEIAGLFGLLAGPVVYFTSQLSIVLERGPSWELRSAMLWYFAAMVAVLVTRALQVLPKYASDLREMKRGGDR